MKTTGLRMVSWLSNRSPRQAQGTLSVLVRGESARFVWAPDNTFRLPPSCFSQAPKWPQLVEGHLSHQTTGNAQGFWSVLILQTWFHNVPMPGAPEPLGRVGTMSSRSRHMLLAETGSPGGAMKSSFPRWATARHGREQVPMSGSVHTGLWE